MTIGLALTSLAVALVMIAILWSWIYYLASHGLGVWVNLRPGIRIANLAIICGTLVGAIAFLGHYWTTHGVKPGADRQYSAIITMGTGAIWLLWFMFWLERLGKRRGWIPGNREPGSHSDAR